MVTSITEKSARELRDLSEANPFLWLSLHFGNHVRSGYAEHHKDFWRYVWDIPETVSPIVGGRLRDAFVAVWPRGGGKSTSGELAIAAIAARRRRRFGIVVSSAQSQANERVQNVASLITNRGFATYYPEVASRAMRRYSTGRWNASEMQTASGFTLRAFGLDAAMRGAKVEDYRPDFIWLDDIDVDGDSAYMTAQKVTRITKGILPMAAPSGAVTLVTQNIIIRNGVVDRLVHDADWLANRIVSGPHPAIRGFRYEPYEENGRTRYRITDGYATWEGQDLKACQELIDREGIDSFLTEQQHELGATSDLVFSQFNPEIHAWRKVKQVMGRYIPALPDFDRYYGGIDYGGEGQTAHKSTCVVLGYDKEADRLILVDTWEDNGAGVEERQREFMYESVARYGRIFWRGGGDQYRENARLRREGFSVADNDRSSGAVSRREKKLATRLGRFSINYEGTIPPPRFMYVANKAGSFPDQMMRLRRQPVRADDEPSRRATLKVNDDLVDGVEYAVEECDRNPAGRSDVLYDTMTL